MKMRPPRSALKWNRAALFANLVLRGRAICVIFLARLAAPPVGAARAGKAAAAAVLQADWAEITRARRQSGARRRPRRPANSTIRAGRAGGRAGGRKCNCCARAAQRATRSSFNLAAKRHSKWRLATGDWRLRQLGDLAAGAAWQTTPRRRPGHICVNNRARPPSLVDRLVARPLAPKRPAQRIVIRLSESAALGPLEQPPNCASFCLAAGSKCIIYLICFSAAAAGVAASPGRKKPAGPPFVCSTTIARRPPSARPAGRQLARAAPARRGAARVGALDNEKSRRARS